MTLHDPLFTSFRIGDLELPNRVVMAPMFRGRGRHESHTPNSLLEAYYAQRASAGLIVTEACAVSEQGINCYRCTGIYSAAQVDAWRKVTDRVHEAGGRVFLQLLHAGRASHVMSRPGGSTPVAPSAIRGNSKTLTSDGFALFSQPRALLLGEIPEIVADFRAAARRARVAGFDGVEIHAANGYLLDQFMKDGSNERSDDYGGSIENRIRLTLEVLEAVKSEWDAGCVGIRVAPGAAQDASDSDPVTLFTRLVDEIDRCGAAYLHIVEGTASGTREVAGLDYRSLRRRFKGVWITNNGYTAGAAAAAIDAGDADLVSFGRPFAANPDLVDRFRRGVPLNEVDKSTLFIGEAQGLLDYQHASLA
jgi:N-ethylmaleimide reductase